MEDKIALCFLTYNNFSQPMIWESFQYSKYNFYIHNKENFSGIFQKYCIKNKVPTKWGNISLVKASINLFKEAFKFEENKYFVLLSDKCIPLYQPDVLYQKIFEVNNNMLNSWRVDPKEKWYKLRYESIAQRDFFDKNNFYGQHQWMILNRETVKYFIENDYTHVFGNKCDVPDETYFINIMKKFNIPSISKIVTYVNWNEDSDLKKYKKRPKTYSNLTNQIIENILKSNAFFMRKVGPECNLPSYFNKFKPLKFIHITKTAGTSIEMTGKKNNIDWGMYHKEYQWWHEPFIKKSECLKQKYNWFLVVRNPYTRIISEFYCKWGTQIKNKTSVNKNEFNRIIKQHILQRNSFNKNGQKGHYIEQYLYLDKKYNIHILKFENLNNDFNNLMKKYSLNIKLDTKQNKGNKIYTVDSLSSEVIQIINNVYDKDFKIFGYEKISI